MFVVRCRTLSCQEGREHAIAETQIHKVQKLTKSGK